VLINLDASKHAVEIVQALPYPLAMAKSVLSELEEGRRKGRAGLASVLEMTEKGLIKTLEMGEMSERIFEELVIGDSASTLDDGEAETIAIAIEQEGMALIDERKATRVCSERFPELPVICTLDCFNHPDVQRTLGQTKLAEALEHALREGRMRTPVPYLKWVLGVIGNETATLLYSLPKSVRLPKNKRQP
jgi:predicted nucleic acid-binding protein